MAAADTKRKNAEKCISIPMSKPTQKQIAAALGISPRRVSQLKRDGMPVDSLEAALLWREERDTGDGSSEALRRERIRLVRAQAAKAEHQLEVERGRYIELEQAKATEFAIGVCVRTAVLNLEGTLPPMLEGLSAVKIQKALHQHLRDILERISDGDPRLWRAGTTETDLALEFLRQHAPEILKP